MSINISIDLETLGRRPGAVIAAIGAVAFDRDGIHQEFYTTIDLDSALSCGLTVTGSTILWWLKQSEEARKALYAPKRAALPLTEALLAFSSWLSSAGEFQLWGNGSDFDNVMLQEAYERVGFEAPWPFWMNRCLRTIRSSYPDVERTIPVISHHALYDAHAQAEHLIAIQRAHPEAKIL